MGKRVSGSSSKGRRAAVINIMLPLIILFAAGCSAVDRNVNFLYQPTSLGWGGSGDLYLTRSDLPPSGKEAPAHWVIGQFTNANGENGGRIVSVRSPMEIMMDAFAQEFKSAGYRVLPVTALPDGVAKGIKLEGVTIRLDEVDSLYKVETKCTVTVSVEPWRNGSPIKKFTYENSRSDSTYIDRDLFLLKSLQSTMQELLARIVREVSVMMEK